MLTEKTVTCPYCGEAFTSLIDPSQESHSYVEDCYVCCRPIEFSVAADGTDVLGVEVKTDSE